jgi:hypothetical protein
MEIAGHGWATRIVTRDSAFLLPTLNRLTIRDLWIEQVATGGAAIQSFHVNLRDIRLIRLKITMRDQATCQNNCISLVVDSSPPGNDGITGVKGLLIEDCWLAPGRMGIEVQNHRLGKKLYGYQDVTMRGCTVWKAPVFAGMGVSLTGWGTDCLISHNRFVACHGPNVEIVGSDRTTVIDNVFDNAVGSAVSATNWLVTGCRILRNRTTGSVPGIPMFLQAIDGGEVSGNVIGGRGPLIIKAANLHIHGNVFYGVGTPTLMQFDNADHVIVENNQFKSTGKVPARLTMIIAFNNTHDCVIRHNRLERADYDVSKSPLWFFQAAPARGSRSYGNERHGMGRTVREPSL